MAQDSEVMRERAVFYIDRRIALLETAAADHARLAQMGVSYAERRHAEQELDEKREKNQAELEAMQWARATLLKLEF